MSKPLLERNEDYIISLPLRGGHLLEDFVKNEFDQPLQEIDLIDIFCKRSDVYLQLFCFCYDDYSGARKLFTSPKYYIDNLVNGLYYENSLVIDKGNIEIVRG